MSAFEKPAHKLGENPDIDVRMPDEIDDKWCAAFNARYSGTRKRAIYKRI